MKKLREIKSKYTTTYQEVVPDRHRHSVYISKFPVDKQDISILDINFGSKGNYTEGEDGNIYLNLEYRTLSSGYDSYSYGVSGKITIKEYGQYVEIKTGNDANTVSQNPGKIVVVMVNGNTRLQMNSNGSDVFYVDFDLDWDQINGPIYSLRLREGSKLYLTTQTSSST